MQTAVPSSAAAYGGGGHWSDGGGGGGAHDDGSAAATTAAAASEVFRDFTWYSAMLLSHLFALEHAQLVRDAAAEDARRRTATAHSPQLLMRAAVAAANAPATPTSLAASGASESGSGSVAAAAEEAATAERLSQLTTQHRPHILLGFTARTAGSGHGGSEETVLNDPATRWTAPTCASEEGRDGGGEGSGPAAAGGGTAPLLAVFDAFYFPAELFQLHHSAGASLAADNAAAAGGELGEFGGNEGHEGVGSVGGENASVADAAAAAAAAGAAPRVTPEALREAFHTLLLLGQRCAAFALTYHGIIGNSGGGPSNDSDVAHATDHHHAHHTGFSSEDELRGGGAGAAGDGGTGDRAALQQAASASLQFMLQLACSCPCAPLSYAAQLCLAHALAVQPAPQSTAGWAARDQLLRFLPTLQPPSRGVTTTATDTVASPTSATAGSGAPPTGGAAAGGNTRVPATQYVCAEDPMLWFDAAGAVHVMTAQQWCEAAQQRQRTRGGGTAAVAASLQAHCGPLPATTALPTVQRLLMEEDQYMGPNGSAAAVLQSMLEAVAAEVTLNARALPGSSSSLVHNSLRRRRGVHSSSSGGGGSGPANAVGVQHRGGGGLVGGFSPSMSDTSPEMEGRLGSPTLPGAPSSGAHFPPAGGSGGAVATPTAGAATSPRASSRLSKAAKRRRALLFALAQSHLLPPTLQLTTSKTLLYGVFTDGGECPTYYLLLSLYPDILRAHHASLHYVLFEDGPLSVDVRLMVAAMAASRHRCEYLVSRFTALLLRYAEEAMLGEGDDDDGISDTMSEYDGVYRGGGGGGGGNARHNVHGPLYHSSRTGDTDDEAGGVDGFLHSALEHLPCRGQARHRWITRGPPARLRAVQHLIAVTAHTPWMLNEKDIRAVLAAGWTIPEVFQLAAIVAQVVPLCSFVMGMFVPAEPWTMTLLPLEVVRRLGHRAVTEEMSSANTSGAAGNTSSGGGGSGGGGMVSSGSSGALTGLRRSPNVTTEGMGGAACPGPATPHHVSHGRTLLGSAASGSDMSAMGATAGATGVSADVYRRYAGEDNIVSEQRIKGGSGTVNPHTLWRSQFTWNEVGATLMEQYYPGAATLMSEEIECYFDLVRQLTKADCVGLMSPDYTPSYAFRSLQLYVQNLLGFMVEDYPYNDINKVLRRPAKWFAQVLTMRPETLTRSEVVRWYVPTTPPTGKPSDLSAESSLVTHQLKREIELLSVVDSAQGGHRGGIESASAHPEQGDNPPPTPSEAARDAAEAEALQTALTLQDERVLLLIALATMEARKEGLLHILLRPICSVLSNM